MANPVSSNQIIGRAPLGRICTECNFLDITSSMMLLLQTNENVVTSLIDSLYTHPSVAITRVAPSEAGGCA